ncbi:MAG: murein biosynthesis integral membrane protein MurJ [Microthrixaceae bacterium]
MTEVTSQDPDGLEGDHQDDDGLEWDDWEDGAFLDEAAAEEPVAPQRSILASSAIPAIGTTLSRVTGLVRVAALTAALGLTSVADVYNLANTTPNILYELVIGGVLSATLVPLFIKANDDPDDESASVMVTGGFVAITALTIVAVLLSPLINQLFTYTVEGAERARQAAIGDDFLVLLLPQVFFYGMTTLATALLNARRRFAAPAFAPVLTNLVISAAALIVWKVIGPDTGEDSMSTVYVLGIGTTAGVAAMAVALMPAIRRAGITLRWDFRPRHPAVRAVLRLSGWTVGFAVANQIALLIVLTLARGAGTGAVSAYQYAFIFFQLPYGLIAVSIMTAVLPELASAAHRGDHELFTQKFREGLSLLLTFMIPATGAYLLLGRPLIALLLQRGEFDAAATDQTLEMLVGFSFGLPAFAVFLYCVRAFYARRNTRSPFYLNLFENALNVALVVPLVALFDDTGLSLAYSVAYWVAAALAIVVLNRHVRGLLRWSDLAMFVRPLIVAAVVVAALAAAVLTVRDSVGDLLELLIGLGVAVPVFVVATFVLRPHGFEPMIDRVTVGMRRRAGRAR